MCLPKVTKMKGRQRDTCLEKNEHIKFLSGKEEYSYMLTYVNKVFCLKETPTVLFNYITCLAPMHLRLPTLVPILH